MSNWYYTHLGRVFGDRIRMLYTYTNSLIVHVQTEDIYADMAQHANLFDTSNYSADHFIYSVTDKKV